MEQDAVLRKVDEALSALRTTISGEREPPYGATLHQLGKMVEVFESIREELVAGRLSPRDQRNSGVGRAVVDSWSLGSELGGIVLGADQSYRSLPEP